MCGLRSEDIQMEKSFHALSSLAADPVKDFLEMMTEALDGWSLKEQEARSPFSPTTILDCDRSKK